MLPSYHLRQGHIGIDTITDENVKVNDEGRISIAPIFSPPPDILKLGSFCFAISHTDAVKPTFRTPPEALQQGEEEGPKDLQGF